jgi:hypothetical protein
LPYPKDDKKLAAWKAALDHALLADRSAWDSFDAQFMTVVQTYNTFLATTNGYVALDWQMVKALCWVESGAANDQWTTKPMQIGVTGDPGLHQILETDSGKLVLPPAYKTILTMANVKVDGNRNIEAGVGYLLWGFASFGFLPDAVQPPPPPAAPAVGGKHTHAHHAAKPKIKKHYAITGWKPISLASISSHYNGGGDGNYLGKLEYTYNLVTGKATPTEPKSNSSKKKP